MSENNTIFEKIFEKNEALNRINEDIKRNIKLIYVFEAYLEEIHIILVTNKDEVYCFGYNWNGILGFGNNNIIEEFTINEDLSNKQIVEFKNSEYHTIARTSDGKLLCWGNNQWGCLGNKSVDRKTYKPEFNKHLNDETIIDMCCGYRHTLVLTSNKEIYAWGDNDKGQIGNKTNGDVVSIPFKIIFKDEKVDAISCGFNHSMALTESGLVYSWGYNIWGQLGLNDGESIKEKPQRIQIKVEITKISCGYGHSLLLSSEGDIYVCGWNKYRQLGTYKNKMGSEANEEKQMTPIKLDGSEKFIEIASHYNYNISTALSDRNLYYIWGKCGRDGIISAPIETKFKTFDEIFIYYLQITYKTFDFPDGRYKKEFKPLELLGNESFGTKVKTKFIFFKEQRKESEEEREKTKREKEKQMNDLKIFRYETEEVKRTKEEQEYDFQYLEDSLNKSIEEINRKEKEAEAELKNAIARKDQIGEKIALKSLIDIQKQKEYTYRQKLEKSVEIDVLIDGHKLAIFDKASAMTKIVDKRKYDNVITRKRIIGDGYMKISDDDLSSKDEDKLDILINKQETSPNVPSLLEKDSLLVRNKQQTIPCVFSFGKRFFACKE